MAAPSPAAPKAVAVTHPTPTPLQYVSVAGQAGYAAGATAVKNQALDVIDSMLAEWRQVITDASAAQSPSANLLQVLERAPQMPVAPKVALDVVMATLNHVGAIVQRAETNIARLTNSRNSISRM